MDDITLDFKTLDKEKIKKSIPFLIIILSTLFGVYLVSPLFKEGILLNVDQPSHYSRAWCLDSQDMLPPANRCAEWQAGMPINSYYPPLIDLFMVFLGKIIGLQLAYKIIISLALFIPGIGAYLLLDTFGKKLAGAFAYAFIVLNPGSWHIAGFEEIFLVGMWPQAITAGIFLIAITLFIRLMKKPSYKSLGIALIPVLFINHPFTLVASATAYTALIIFQWKESMKNWKWIAGFIALAGILNFYYLLPLVLNIKFISRGDENSWMTWNLLRDYLLTKIAWYVLLIAALGIIATIFSKNKDKKPFLIVAAALFANFLVSFVQQLSGRWTIGIRMEIFMGFFIFMFAGLFLEFLAETKLKFDKRKVSLGAFAIVILFIIMIIPVAKTGMQYSKSMIIVSENDLSALYSPLKTLPPGRILPEETLYNAGQNMITFTHMHMLIPVYSDKELVGIPFNFPPGRILETTEGGMMFAKKLEDYKPGEMEYLLNHYNIRYIVAHTPMYINFFENRSKGKYPLGPFTLFETNITPSFFEIEGDKGTVTLEDYKKNHGKVSVNMAEPGRVGMKVNLFPNWRIYVDGKSAEVESCDLIICAKVPAGSHVIEFSYGYDWKNYAGYFISLIGLIALFSLFFFKNKK